MLVLPPGHALQSKLQSSEGLSYSGKLLALKQLLIDCGIGNSPPKQEFSLLIFEKKVAL